MKSIQLNKEQKIKLIEIIKFYLPKYKHVTIKPTSIFGYDGGMVSVFRKRWSFRGCVIHWYELLTTIVLDAANKKMDTNFYPSNCPDGIL